jgi:hypothetical protein
MQRLHYGTLFTITFTDSADTSSVEDKVSNLMSLKPGEHGWLILNHPTEAGTQVKMSVTPGVPIVLVKQEGAPVVAGEGSVGNWVFVS